jgi:uncharacterized YigZ family protein
VAVSDTYLTIARDGAAEIEIKRSRFICAVKRVESEEDARAFIEETRKRHWDARHNCSAFVLGSDGQVARSNDDGEPAGTAGAPMLEVLRGAGVSDVVAVVTRYFGGILLGAGGLVRAYGDSVRAAIDEVGVLRRDRVDLFEIAVDHAQAGRLENDLRARGLVVRGVDYAERATLRVAAGSGIDLDPLLAEMTGGALAARRVGTDWVDAR